MQQPLIPHRNVYGPLQVRLWCTAFRMERTDVKVAQTTVAVANYRSLLLFSFNPLSLHRQKLVQGAQRHMEDNPEIAPEFITLLRIICRKLTREPHYLDLFLQVWRHVSFSPTRGRGASLLQS